MAVDLHDAVLRRRTAPSLPKVADAPSRGMGGENPVAGMSDFRWPAVDALRGYSERDAYGQHVCIDKSTSIRCGAGKRAWMTSHTGFRVREVWVRRGRVFAAGSSIRAEALTYGLRKVWVRRGRVFAAGSSIRAEALTYGLRKVWVRGGRVFAAGSSKRAEALSCAPMRYADQYGVAEKVRVGHLWPAGAGDRRTVTVCESPLRSSSLDVSWRRGDYQVKVAAAPERSL
jgi:hypothetical protein